MTFGNRKRARGLDDKDKDKPAAKQITPMPPGSYKSAAIILLSDGRRTTGVDTLEAAQLAADRGVRIDVVGLGTVNGSASTPEGLPIYMQLDEPTLREVARMTGGEYHHAGDAETLRSVYGALGSRLQVQTRETEVTALVALASMLVMVLAAGLSVLWFGSGASPELPSDGDNGLYTAGREDMHEVTGHGRIGAPRCPRLPTRRRTAGIHGAQLRGGVPGLGGSDRHVPAQ
jgi:hypothetical protein